MSNNKQTAVEWLAEQMLHPEFHNPYIEQALEMEKEIMINFTYNYINSGSIGCLWDGDSAPELDIDTDPKKFYEQTYGGNK
jgi:hypothetical protein